MNKTVFIPKRCRVGFNGRSDTYSGKLGYVIYWDARGVLRKEDSFNSWRSHGIPVEDFDNVPTEGFVLNKKVGGNNWSSWNPRQTYSRVYDPRGFEIEITVPNLLYILENTNSIKGKGLEGKFVYGWDGTELLLIPEGAPEFSQIQEFSELLAKGSVLSKDLILGATYLTNQNETVVYCGRFDKYRDSKDYRTGAPKGSNEGKFYYFKTKSESSYNAFLHLKSLSKRILKVVDETPVSNYAEIMEQLEKTMEFSPHDPSKDIYEPVIPPQTDGLKYYDNSKRWLTNAFGFKVTLRAIEEAEGFRIYVVNAFDKDGYPDRNTENVITTLLINEGYYAGWSNPVKKVFPLEQLLTVFPPLNLRRFQANGKEIK